MITPKTIGLVIIGLLFSMLAFANIESDSVPTTTVFDSTYIALPKIEANTTVNQLEVDTLVPYSNGIIYSVDAVESIPQLEQYQADTISEKAKYKAAWKPDPMRAVWLGAVVPGLGQIYNKKYWKVPIVYAGFMGCAYAISWNTGMYTDYKNGYRDIIDTDENTNSFMDILPEGYTIDRLGGIASYTSILQTRMNLYRRYRDLSVIATIAFYALTLVDAFVDAQLYDFDISPDLSLQIQPAIYRNEYNNKRNAELQLTFKF